MLCPPYNLGVTNERNQKANPVEAPQAFNPDHRNFLKFKISLTQSSEAMAALGQLFRFARGNAHVNVPLSSPYPHFNSTATVFVRDNNRFSKLTEFSGHRTPAIVSKASSANENIVPADDIDEGVSLGTMKLPSDIDIPRFETLLFQWANSLCQGATLPLPVPLKVDKIPGGARLGFITIGEGKTEVPVYIDCLVFPATEGSNPMFRAIRNGISKDQAPPGEPRIMRSLMEALKKSVEIARI